MTSLRETGGASPSPAEIWKDIPGYEGQYQASSLGRIRSLDRYVARKRRCPGRVLKPSCTGHHGYPHVNLRPEKNARPVHQLIARTFHGPCPKGCEVLHSNGNKLDNRPENLRYDSRMQNMLDIYRQGKRYKKLDLEDVGEIRFGLACGLSCAELGRMYGIDPSAISKIKHGVRYGWMT